MKDSEIIIYLYKKFIDPKNNYSFYNLYERLFQDDPDTLPGTIIIRGVKRYTSVMRELRYRRPMMSDFRDLDKVMSEFLREMNSFRQEFWYWKELKLKSNE
jgi:hypothetical protein